MTTAPVSRATVLVVDDTPQNLELLDECLSPHYRVKVATGGARALALCAAEAPDLVILDVMMPDMDGYETLRRLKAEPGTRSVPVIFATAKGEKTDEHLGLQLGAADYVTKPIHIPVLLARVATHLALYDYQRNLEKLVRQRTAQLAEALKRVEKDERKLQANLSRLAYARNHDELTSLANRPFLMRQLGEMMKEALLEGGNVTVMAVNLDRFRVINQALGASIGDELLTLVAQRLQAVTKPGDLLARAGGDEFILVVGDRNDAVMPLQRQALSNRMSAQLDKMLTAVREPMSVQGHPVQLTASAGFAVFPFDGQSPSELLRNAGLAATAAKRAGRNRALSFQSQWATSDAQRYERESKLRTAIGENRIVPYYQPKLHAATGALLGAEALIRWPNEEGGYNSPGEFLPLAEDCGLMETLDDLMIHSVMRQVAAWGARLPAGFRVAVNVSSHRFHDGLLPEQIKACLAETGAAPEHLELEITEGALIGDPTACATQLDQLRTLGVELTLDDFGTGYSSLSYLKQLPLQHLKVDQSFVRDIERNANDAAIVRAVIALAEALNLQTVAEGVETAAQLKFVQELGCHAVQGFLFSPAVSAEDFSQLIDAGRIALPAG